jgi:hypothetical protein
LVLKNGNNFFKANATRFNKPSVFLGCVARTGTEC